MTRNVMFAVLMWTILLLSLMRAPFPVWVGVGLLAIVVSGIRVDLSAKSARKRWAAFKRLVVITCLGLVLITAGASSHVPWTLDVVTVNDARTAIFSLLIYSMALLLAPALLWFHLAQRERTVKCKQRCLRRQPQSLTNISASGCSPLKAAV